MTAYNYLPLYSSRITKRYTSLYTPSPQKIRIPTYTENVVILKRDMRCLERRRFAQSVETLSFLETNFLIGNDISNHATYKLY